MKYSQPFLLVGNSKRKRFVKRENKERIMGSWENEVSVTVLVKSFTEFRGDWNSKQMGRIFLVTVYF